MIERTEQMRSATVPATTPTDNATKDACTPTTPALRKATFDTKEERIIQMQNFIKMLRMRIRKEKMNF